MWQAQPQWGLLPFLAPLWAHIMWGPQRLGFTPLRLLHAMIAPMVLASHLWEVPLLR